MEKSFETPGPVRLYVEVGVGAVRVRAHGSRATEIRLEAERGGAEDLADRATVEHHATPERHVVAVKVPRQRGPRATRRDAVTVLVTVPEASDVRIVTGSAGIEVAGPIGAADITTTSGDASFGDVGSDFVAKTASGNITVANVHGKLRVQSVTGNLRCESADSRVAFSTTSGDLQLGDVRDRVEVKATSGHVSLGRLEQGARVANVSGDVRVQAVGSGDIRIRSVSGDVFVGVARGVDLHVDVQSMSGSVQSNIPLLPSPQAGIQEARVNISIRSVSGDVEIAQAQAAAA